MSYEYFLELVGNTDTYLYTSVLMDGLDAIVDGVDVLTYLVKENYSDLVILYLDLDMSDVNGSRNTKQENPLGWAIYNNNLEIVAELTFCGANILAGTLMLGPSQTVTVLGTAIMRSYKKVIEFLMNKGLDVRMRINSYILHIAIKREDIKFVRDLIALGISVDSIYEGRHPIWISRSLAITDMLIKAGSNVNFIDPSTKDNILCRMYNRNYDIVQLLIDNGANANYRRPEQTTPIHVMFIRMAKPEIILQLLAHKKTDITALDSEGNTYLHYAVRYNCVPACEYLLDTLSLSARNSLRQTPLDIAIGEHNSKIITLILQRDKHAILHVVSGWQESCIFMKYLAKYKQLCHDNISLDNKLEKYKNGEVTEGVKYNELKKSFYIKVNRS